MDKEKFESAKIDVEDDLRNYPYWIIEERLPNLGKPTRWGEVHEKSRDCGRGSSVEASVLENEGILKKIKIIDEVLNKLNKESKTIIEELYFRDSMRAGELQRSLGISRSTLYRTRNKALKKFMIALRYL